MGILKTDNDHVLSSANGDGQQLLGAITVWHKTGAHSDRHSLSPQTNLKRSYYNMPYFVAETEN